MNLTAYHAKFFAHELTKRSSSDSVDKLASVVSYTFKEISFARRSSASSSGSGYIHHSAPQDNILFGDSADREVILDLTPLPNVKIGFLIFAFL